MEASTLTHSARRGLLARRSPILKLEKDERLVAMIRGGHDGAFETLFNRYQPRLLAFCNSMLRSRQDAEDVLQEVFTNAHKAMLADDRKINVRPWLYRIARNRCLNHLRKPVPEGQDSMDIHAHLNGTSTADRVQKREELRQVLNDVGTLPETQRTALLLREIDQLSYEDIAVAMETTIPAVKSLLVRARITLAESSEARTLSCDEVRVTLAEAAEGIRKANGPVRLHVRKCETCSHFRNQLRSDRKALAALFPIGPLALLKVGFLGKIFGGGTTTVAGAGSGAGAGSAGTALGAVGGSAAAGSTATAGGLGAIGGAIGTKAAAGVATAALLTAGAVEVREIAKPAKAPQPAAVERVETPPPPANKGPKKPKPRTLAVAPAAAATAVAEDGAASTQPTVAEPEATEPAAAEPEAEPEIEVEGSTEAYEDEVTTGETPGREADGSGDPVGGPIGTDPSPTDPPAEDAGGSAPAPPAPGTPPPGKTSTGQAGQANGSEPLAGDPGT